MKVTFDIDCTPDEARRFLGLPDVAPLQEAMMKEMEERMREGLNNLDPETFMKTWLPMSVQNWGEMQKIFWSQMGLDPSKGASESKKSSEKKG